MSTIALAGCSTRPLGSFLQALGVLRLVGMQADSSATGEWHGDVFHLTTTLTPDNLVDFFSEGYAPTPVISPWNGGSGFGDKDQQAGIAAIERSTTDRFEPYRRAIAVGRDLVKEPGWDEGRDAKARQIARCRAALPDEAVEWLDASVVLAGDRLASPPVFGTGGNDGRLDFSNNFMQRLAEILLVERRKKDPDPRTWLRAALFGDNSGELAQKPGGQYSPASAEPGISSPTGGGTALLNPWAFILMIEGGLVFASGAARRLGGGTRARATMPFCVDSTSVGHPSSAPAEESRGELWAPVWRQPATAAEVGRLIGEGRASWRNSDAANGADFAKAAASLGVDRGIERFVRHGLVQRYGLSYLAVPLGEIMVGSRPEVKVLAQVDGWLERLPYTVPSGVASARRRVEAAEFRCATATGTDIAGLFQEVLMALSELELAVARSRGVRAESVPVGAFGQGLVAAQWLPLLDDGTAELHLAAALASARDRYAAGQLSDANQRGSSLALFLRPIRLDSGGRVGWTPAKPRVDGLGRRSVADLLAEVMELRFRDALDAQEMGEPVVKGPAVGWDLGIPASIEDLVLLVEGRLDTDRLGRLLGALLLLDWRGAASADLRLSSPGAAGTQPIPSALSVLLPFFQKRVLVDRSGGEVWLRPSPRWARLLRSGGADGSTQVVEDALRRLRISGCSPALNTVRADMATTGPLLASACLTPYRASAAARLLHDLAGPDVSVNSAASSPALAPRIQLTQLEGTQ